MKKTILRVWSHRPSMPWFEFIGFGILIVATVKR